MKRQFEKSRSAERTALETLEAIEARLAGTTEARGRARRLAAELAAEQSRLVQRRDFLDRILEERQVALTRLAESIESLAGEEAERQEMINSITVRRRALAGEREAARGAWQDAARAFSAATERLGLLRERQAAVGDELLGRVRRPSVLSDRHLAALSTIEALARQAIEVIKDRIGILRHRQANDRMELETARTNLEGLRRQTAQLASEMDAYRTTLSESAVLEAESRVRREAVAEGLRREVDADEDLALAAPKVEGEDLAGLLAQRQAELRRMGPVNPLAAEEYGELSARHDFLSAQLDDLEQSKGELRRVMAVLDQEIQARFNAAFEEVAAAYHEYFGVLFPGGTGRMRLTNPDDQLNSGVEIEAQPMGKKIGNLSLLSGGERSLAALAFLFGVFKARPSPFYILDEVEAALDDSNLRRFLRLVETFRSESQLVLITHQQQTMEVADILYGVTMEPGGSSQVLSRDLAAAGL
jgi:chromosome segregation protein